MTKIGSREYWSNRQSYPEDWAARSVLAARHVQPGMRILEIGCGPHMALRKFLPAGCTYVPSDLYPWTSEVQHADVDADRFPDGVFDYVFMLGVLEYLQRPELAFRFAQARASAMVISYCHPVSADMGTRGESGWINAFSIEDLAKHLAASGWFVAHSETFRLSQQTHQLVYWLCKTPRL